MSWQSWRWHSSFQKAYSLIHKQKGKFTYPCVLIKKKSSSINLSLKAQVNVYSAAQSPILVTHIGMKFHVVSTPLYITINHWVKFLEGNKKLVSFLKSFNIP